MPPISNHPQRFELANELHARPFPVVAAGGQAAVLALKQVENAVARDRDQDLVHLLALLDRHGASHPRPGATHYSGTIGRFRLKWEQHTEFVTYMVIADDMSGRPFDGSIWDVFPAEWLAEVPGHCVTSAHFRIAPQGASDAEIKTCLDEWFVGESLAAARVLDDHAVIASDFRVDEMGHMRFAVFPSHDCQPTRIGRVVQRLAEIETYKAMAMLGLQRARGLNKKMGEIDQHLSGLLADITSKTIEPEVTLEQLLSDAAELENLMTNSSFRFGATGAYAAIVEQRVIVLREARFNGGQTFGEFMMRRFDPAMRTVTSTEARLKSMTDRAFRAGELLRTQVEVKRATQNQALLASMDRRAELQLRLQETVEGLSVVAISYYAVNLLAYLLAPVASGIGIEKAGLTAGLVLPVILLVWYLTHRIKNGLH